MPWRLNGVRVYEVKGKRKSKKKTYKTKSEAMNALHRKRGKKRKTTRRRRRKK